MSTILVHPSFMPSVLSGLNFQVAESGLRMPDSESQVTALFLNSYLLDTVARR